MGSRKRASDAVNITSLTTQLFYAVLLDFMTAYQLVGFNAKLTPETVKELKKCKNIEENMLKYITNYSGVNVNSKKDLKEPGKNMLGELQKPKYDPNSPNKKRTQMKVIPARLCGGGQGGRLWQEANRRSCPAPSSTAAADRAHHAIHHPPG